MSASITKLHLDCAQQRRVGLDKREYKLEPLLLRSNASANSHPALMALKSAPKRPVNVRKSPMKEVEEDIGREPDSSSDSENDPDPSDIKGTDYGSIKETIGHFTHASRKENALTDRATNEDSRGIRTATRSANAVHSPSNSSVSSRNSTKRKGEEQPPKLGGGKTDIFGNVVQRPGKKAMNTYGNAKPPKIRVPRGGRKAKEKLKQYDQVDQSPQKSNSSKGLKVFSDIDTSPESTPKKTTGLNRHADLGFTPTPTKDEPKALRKYGLDDLSDSDEDSVKQVVKNLRLPSTDESPAKQIEGLKPHTLYLGTDLLSTAKAIIDKDRDELGPVSQDMDYDFTSMTQRACCPMCGADVSPEDIRAHSKNGVMNIRVQEKFCRAHKVRTAQDHWDIEGYPPIDWDNLDSRISKHHAFIKKLINGQSSHYRDLWDENVAAGGDRNLRKMTSNLTPGFYGARGLRIFSENIMHKFTPLLKRRAPQDPLISARGFAAYVQSVLVPEVAVQLIMEDMGRDIEQARQVLAESVEVGELLNEEIKDVVTRRVVDSEGEDESD
ncbi:hypothetical protein WAI453_012305 [Rhynchosporium graminicola]|uniref:Restriction of telomere capping protein 4 n=1 Tax=Rhynchosporium graminicola TaxID=2792576 RepID=A0A1E1KZ23_9HELO|nr:uncharacterized protein RCO7_06123 [Rhynchosporium commune]